MRRLSLFALIFITLAGLYFLLEAPEKKRASREPEQLLSGFDPAAVGRIIVTCPREGRIALQRADAGWQVSADQEASYAADISAVQQLLDSLAALKAGSMVSRNPDRHALYEVSPETGLLVETLDRNNRPLAELLIGKSGPNIFSTYVRTANSDEVYLVDGILQNTASKTVNQWRDKTIFALDPELVRAYTLSGTHGFVLRKNAEGWQAAADSAPPIDAAAIERVVRTFVSLSAADYAEGPLEEFGLAAPERTVTAEFADGTSATLLLGSDANAFQQYAKTADSATVYIVEKYLLDALCPSLEDLNPAPESASEETPAEGQSDQ